MEYYELQLKNLIEAKLVRLNRPKFNTSSIPLSGEYLPEGTSDQLENELSDSALRSFQYSEVFTSSNYMQIANNFGKILFGDTLEALMIIVNLSKFDDMRIKEFKVIVTNEELTNYTNNFKRSEFIVFEASNLYIPAGKYFSQKITFNADIMSKYHIIADIQYSCNTFNNEYIKNSTGKIIKSSTDQYYIEAPKGIIVRKYQKKMMFDNNMQFRLKDKIYGCNLNKGYLEINITNQSAFTLRIVDVSIFLVKGIYFLNENTESMAFGPIVPYEEITLAPEDEINLVYCFETYNDFLKIESFACKVSWCHVFDTIPKYYNFPVKNKLTNDIFLLNLHQIPPNETVIQGETYQIKFIVKNIFKSKAHLIFINRGDLLEVSHRQSLGKRT